MTVTLWSILIPAIPSRLAGLSDLVADVQEQIGERPIEILSLLDNRRMTIGEKRQRLVEQASGRYISFVDDDDDVHPDYVSRISDELTKQPAPDLVSFDFECDIAGVTGIVTAALRNPNEDFRNGGVTRRKPHQLCVWRTDLVYGARFPHTNRGEDFAWAQQMWPRIKREARVDKVLYRYNRRRSLREAYPA